MYSMYSTNACEACPCAKGKHRLKPVPKNCLACIYGPEPETKQSPAKKEEPTSS